MRWRDTRVGWTVLSAGVPPEPPPPPLPHWPDDTQCQSIVRVPIDGGCSGTLPWASLNEEPESQRDQLNGATRVALTADNLDKELRTSATAAAG